ncbi:UDP-N-acetylglucosamine transferase [compost metagenome]
MVIDDLANRPHDCDVLLDQNLCAGMETRYEGLVPEACLQLIGPRYALLRPEFRRARSGLSPRDGQVRRMLIFFGGVDATNETTKALEALEQLALPNLAIDVVVGASNPHQDVIRVRCERAPRTSLHVAVPHMAELMSRADLAIGAGGTTTWERCYLGLPTLILTLADNQVPLVQAVSAAKAAWNLGPAESVGVEEIQNALQRVISEPGEIAEVSRNAWSLMAGNDPETGVAGVLLEARHDEA